MKQGRLPELPELLRARVGSARCGLLAQESDRDIFVLTTKNADQLCDPEKNETYFIWSVPMLRSLWGHPLLLENLTGSCTGNQRLCNFLWARKRELYYTSPACTTVLGLKMIAEGERYGFTSPIKVGLRIAMELAHMAWGDEDPIVFSAEETAVLLRARTGDVPPDERVDIYRRTISPENINRLLKMPDHPTIKNELFQLIDNIISKEDFLC